MDKELTTIAISVELKNRIDKEKIHPNQSYDEILKEIIDKLK